MKENLKVPKELRKSSLSTYLENLGIKRIHQGKVRDTYQLDDNRLLTVATDRISIFDFVLNASIPLKGDVLTALTHFWATEVLSEYPNHLINSTSVEGKHYNSAYDLKKNSLSGLPISRCLVVKNMSGKVCNFEMIFRHHIGGSVFKSYEKSGMAAGHKLPMGLPKWSKLYEPLFTPSTKEEVGHDVNVDVYYFYKEMKKIGQEEKAKKAVKMLQEAYSKAYQFAYERGVLILDTKLEIVIDPFMIVDEKFTPDSSRYSMIDDWQKAMEEGRDPSFQDKEPVRIWGRSIETPFTDDNGNKIFGIHKLEPENPEHLSFVHGIKVPDHVVKETTTRYLNIFKVITGYELAEYQKKFMGVEKEN